MIRRLLVLAFLILCVPTAAEARWRQASGRHFVIYSEQDEAELRQFAERLERFDAALRVQLRRPDPDRSPATRLTIIVMNDILGLQSLLGNDSIAGIYMPRASGSHAFTFQDRSRDRSALNARVVLFHEYTHHFLFNNFAFAAPLWFSEGYAEFWATVDFEPDGSVKVGLPATHRNMELSYTRTVPVRSLLDMHYPIRDAMLVSAAYAKGWLLSHYLSFNPGRRGQLDAYLRALGSGQTPAQAAGVFGDLGALDREVNRYLGQPRFTFATIPVAQLPIAPVTIRELRPGEAAMMRVRMRLKRGVTEAQARALVGEARSNAASYPSDPEVQVLLAEAEHDAGNFTEAEAAADRAIAAAPDSVEAHLYKGRAIWGRILASGHPTRDQWRQVQQQLMAANRIDPDDPEPLVYFYRSFLAAGWPVTENAVAGLLYAHQLAPEDASLRMTAGRQLIVSGNLPAARRALSPFTSTMHGSGGAEIVETLALLDRGDRSAALARLDAAIAARDRPPSGRGN